MVTFWKGTREQSENFEGNTGTRTPPGRPSIVYKSEAGSHRPPPDSGAPLLYRFVLQTVVFAFFALATFPIGPILQSQR